MVLLVVFTLIGPSSAETYVVDDDGGSWADYTTIQDAVNGSTDGNDTIFVYNGTYHEQVEVNVTTTLVGNGTNTTIVDSAKFHGPFKLLADNITISGFRCINSGVSGSGIKIMSENNTVYGNLLEKNDYGIRVYYGKNNSIFENVFRGNNVGIYLQHSEDNIIENNSMTENKKGILLSNSNWNVIMFNNCSSNSGRGIDLTETVSSNVTIRSNTCNDNNDGIAITGSDNNVSENCCERNEKSGIFIINCVNSTFRKNICSDNGNRGINLNDPISTGVLILSNICSDNNKGIVVLGRNNNISKNDCNGNYQHGIHAMNCFDSVFWKNNCSNNADRGIFVKDSNRNWLRSNTLKHNSFGISFEGSDNNTVLENVLVGNGFGVIPDYTNQKIEVSNTVNGRPVYYYHNKDGAVVPKGAGQIILVKSDHCIVTDQNLSNASSGLLIIQSNDVTVFNVTSNDNEHGFYVYDSKRMLIENCTISNCSYGIHMTSPYDRLKTSNIIRNTTCTEGWTGLYLFFSGYNTIYSCNFNNNSEYGIYIKGSSNNMIDGSFVHDNNDGIYVLGVDWCNWVSVKNVIVNTWIMGNHEYGAKVTIDNEGSLNARSCWWGDPSGPNSSVNPNGTGDRITGGIRFDPWLKTPPDHVTPIAVIEEIGPDPADEDDIVLFSGSAISKYGTRYIWNSSLDGTFYNGTNEAFETDNLSFGHHNITLTVVDDYGAFSATVNASFRKGHTPTIAIVVSPRTTTYGNPFLFEATTNSTFPIAFFVWSSDIEGEFYNGSEPSFEHHLDLVGEHIIRTRVTDVSGLRSEEAHIQIAIRTIPLISIESPSNNSVIMGLVSIEGTASDFDSAVQAVEISFDGITWTNVSGTETWSFVWDTTQVENGNYTISVRSFDGVYYSKTAIIDLWVRNDLQKKEQSSGSTPGFDVFVLVVAVGVAVLGIHRKKA